MLRFVLRPALIAALMLLVAAPMAPAQSTRKQILRECQNGQLSGRRGMSHWRGPHRGHPGIEARSRQRCR